MSNGGGTLTTSSFVNKVNSYHLNNENTLVPSGATVVLDDSDATLSVNKKRRNKKERPTTAPYKRALTSAGHHRSKQMIM